MCPLSKNESVKMSAKDKESDCITAIRSDDVTKPDDVTRECSGIVRFKECFCQNKSFSIFSGNLCLNPDRNRLCDPS